MSVLEKSMKRDLYSDLAPFYNRLLSEVDYQKWADYLEAQFQKHADFPIREVLDLGCGTGRMTFELAKRGYDMVGVDGSLEMLDQALADSPTHPNGESILWLAQDMTDFELYGTVDATVSCLDCINHLLSCGEIEKCFSLVHNYLVPNGLFLFDMNTPYRLKDVYAGQSFVLEDDGVFCAWQNSFSKASNLCDFTVTLFSACKGGTYTRTDSTETERAYSLSTVKRLLKKTGFQLLSVACDYQDTPISDKTERWYFAARALKP